MRRIDGAAAVADLVASDPGALTPPASTPSDWQDGEADQDAADVPQGSGEAGLDDGDVAGEAALDDIAVLRAAGGDGPRWAAIAEALPPRLQADLLVLRKRHITLARQAAARDAEVLALILAESEAPRFAGLKERPVMERLFTELHRAVFRHDQKNDWADKILALYNGRAPAAGTLRKKLIENRRGSRFERTKSRVRIGETEAVDETESESRTG